MTDIIERLQALRNALHVNELRHSGTRDGNLYSEWGATVAFALIEIEHLRRPSPPQGPPHLERAPRAPLSSYCDIALQDAMITFEDNGERIHNYDDERLVKSLAGNGYKIVPVDVAPLPAVALAVDLGEGNMERKQHMSEPFDMRSFSAENLARCQSPAGFHHPLSSWSLSDWMTATVGELGEAANVLKKLNRVRDNVPGNKETPDELRAMFADELADAFIYLDLLAQASGIDFPAAIRSKFDRTSVKIGYGQPLPAPPKETP